jgi:hypothetical protein
MSNPLMAPTVHYCHRVVRRCNGRSKELEVRLLPALTVRTPINAVRVGFHADRQRGFDSSGAMPTTKYAAESLTQ